MPIENLNSQEFAKDLAQQSVEFVPQDFEEETKNYITKKVYEFCLITGDHLLKQYKEQFTDEQAQIIVQFIGEWAFHKAIDLKRANINSQYWDQILQQVAFAALKAALHSYLNNFEEVKTVTFIEQNVKTAYEECINQLVKAEVIQEDQVEEILSQSNVDKMADEMGTNITSSPEEEERTLKYATIAMFLHKMPPEKIEKVLEKMEIEQRQRIKACLNIENLEQKLGNEVINNYILDLKKNIASLKKQDSRNITIGLKKLQEEYGEEEIINLTIYERLKIQKYISDCLFESNPKAVKVELSPHIVKILYNYLRNKLVA